MKQNKLKYCLLLSGFYYVLMANPLWAQYAAQSPFLPEKICISAEELQLANTINDYRRENNLPVIPLSVSLFFVAQTHARDLSQNHPDNDNCNQHSWSDKGSWKPCCYSKDAGRSGCMTDKPKELTGYKGKGYEMVYWDSRKAVPSDALELWKSIPLTNEMLLNRGKWKTKIWKSCGVGMLGGYALVWFGDATDQWHDIRLCESDSLEVSKPEATELKQEITAIQKNVIQPKPGAGMLAAAAAQVTGGIHYHLIVASCKTARQAGIEVSKLQRKGYHEARVLTKDSMSRVSLEGYATRSEAEKALHKLAAAFKDIWIYKY